MKTSVVSPGNIASVFPLSGVFFISLSVLALEIVFTRLFSVILSYDYVFIVISMALLGLGIGGIFAHATRKAGSDPAGYGTPVLSAGLFSLSIPLTIVAVTKIPGTNILPYALLILVPFFLAGIILSRVFQSMAAQSSKVYFADLTGAGVGALLVIVFLNRFGAINTGLLISLFAATGTLFFAVTPPKKIRFPLINLAVLVSVLMTAVWLPGFWIGPVKPTSEKELAASLYNPVAGASIVETRWTAFGRTDLIKYQNSPEVMSMFTDGTAGASMYQFSGDIRNPGPVVEDMKTSFAGYFPFPALTPDQKDNALIIGPGGGRDVLVALMGGVKQITAVEVNPDFVDIVKEYSDYNGGIYNKFPNVNVVVAEGRSYLRQQKDKFDVIMLSIPITKTSRSPEGFALTENYLFTKESILEYLDHLTPEGRLIVVAHQPLEALKLMSVSVAALKDTGVNGQEAMDYLYMVSNHMNSLFVLSKSKITPQESYQEHQAVHLLSYNPASSYLPYVKTSANPSHVQQGNFAECQMLNADLSAVGSGRISLDMLNGAIAKQGFDMGVVTDNRPFFYKAEKRLPTSLSATFWIAAVFVLISLLTPYLFWKRKIAFKQKGVASGNSNSLEPSFVALFFMLGVGFMLVEVSSIQRFTLFLGEPILSVTVLLFSILMGTGLGGLTSGRIHAHRLSKNISTLSLAIAAVLVAYALLMPVVFQQFLGLSLLVRALVSVMVLMPLGFLMGFIFPLGIRLLKDRNLEQHISWYWGINGVASVLGSVTAIIVAMTLGLTQALLLGAVCYLVIAVCFSGGQKIKSTSDVST